MLNRGSRSTQPADSSIDCVVLSSFLSEFTFLQNVFRTSGIRMHHADSLEEADFMLTVTGGTVLLSDVIFEGGYWQGALALLDNAHSLVTMLVVADPVDEPYLHDVFLRGACGIIWRPFQYQVVARQIRAVHEASLARQALRNEAGANVDACSAISPMGMRRALKLEK